MHKILFVAAGGDKTADANHNNVNFTIRDTKWYVPRITLLAEENQKLSKLLSQGSERLVSWKETKTKSENRNITKDIFIDIF